MKTEDFNYFLPGELIAQTPPPERAASRMMALGRAAQSIAHRAVSDIADYLRPGDLLVMNDTKVFNARAFGHWADSPGRVEVLFVEPDTDLGIWEFGNLEIWKALCKSSRPIRIGMVMMLADDKIRATAVVKNDDGSVSLALECEGGFYEILDEHGAVPVPPYIHRKGGATRLAEFDKSRYQTVYARETGAVAAPTAGLHFTQELLDRIKERGVGEVFVTLHVGPGTFRPVKSEDVEGHTMDSERYEIPQATADAIAETKARGGRVVAVGSTSARTLETCADGNGLVRAGTGRSALFIHPPYNFKTVDMMLTNFHLPCSTLLMMVSAFAGREFILRAYAEAVAQRYRFFSYGDCMLIV